MNPSGDLSARLKRHASTSVREGARVARDYRDDVIEALADDLVAADERVVVYREMAQLAIERAATLTDELERLRLYYRQLLEERRADRSVAA
jgi:hypothetical protein